MRERNLVLACLLARPLSRGRYASRLPALVPMARPVPPDSLVADRVPPLRQRAAKDLGGSVARGERLFEERLDAGLPAVQVGHSHEDSVGDRRPACCSALPRDDEDLVRPPRAGRLPVEGDDRLPGRGDLDPHPLGDFAAAPGVEDAPQPAAHGGLVRDPHGRQAAVDQHVLQLQAEQELDDVEAVGGAVALRAPRGPVRPRRVENHQLARPQERRQRAALHRADVERAPRRDVERLRWRRVAQRQRRPDAVRVDDRDQIDVRHIVQHRRDAVEVDSAGGRGQRRAEEGQVRVEV